MRMRKTFDALRKASSFRATSRATRRDASKTRAPSSPASMSSAIEEVSRRVANAFLKYYAVTRDIQKAFEEAKRNRDPLVLLAEPYGTDMHTEITALLDKIEYWGEEICRAFLLNNLLKGILRTLIVYNVITSLDSEDTDKYTGLPPKHAVKFFTELAKTMRLVLQELERIGYVLVDTSNNKIFVPPEMVKPLQDFACSFFHKDQAQKVLRMFEDSKKVIEEKLGKKQLVLVPIENVGFAVGKAKSLMGHSTKNFALESFIVPCTMRPWFFDVQYDYYIVDLVAPVGGNDAVSFELEIPELLIDHIREGKPLPLIFTDVYDYPNGKYYVVYVTYVPSRYLKDFVDVLKNVFDDENNIYSVKDAGFSSFLEDTDYYYYDVTPRLLEKMVEGFNEIKPVRLLDPETGAPIRFEVEEITISGGDGLVRARIGGKEGTIRVEDLEGWLYGDRSWIEDAIYECDVPYKYRDINDIVDDYVDSVSEEWLAETLANAMFDDILYSKKCREHTLKIEDENENIEEKKVIVCPKKLS